MMNEIAGAVKEIFGFLREWNNADQKQKRWALRRLRRIEKAVDVAERIFFVVDEMIAVFRRNADLKETEAKELKWLEASYRALVDNFNRLD